MCVTCEGHVDHEIYRRRNDWCVAVDEVDKVHGRWHGWRNARPVFTWPPRIRHWHRRLAGWQVPTDRHERQRGLYVLGDGHDPPVHRRRVLILQVSGDVHFRRHPAGRTIPPQPEQPRYVGYVGGNWTDDYADHTEEEVRQPKEHSRGGEEVGVRPPGGSANVRFQHRARFEQRRASQVGIVAATAPTER